MRARRSLQDKGVRFYPSHTVRAALGATGDVQAVELIRVDGNLMPIPGSAVEIACDAVCVAIGLVPNVELLDLLGCRLRFDSARGGFVRETDGWLRTSAPSVFAAGDCAGVFQAMVTDDRLAGDQGRPRGVRGGGVARRHRPRADGGPASGALESKPGAAG